MPLLGTKSRPLGRLAFKAHRGYALPQMLCISIEPDGRWYVSFCAEMQALPGHEVLRTPEELAYEFGLLAPDALEAVTVGIDRGVVQSVACSDERVFDLGATERSRIAKKERQAQRHQKRLARQVKGSKNRARTRQRLARCKGYGANVRRDFAHKTSHALTTSDAQVLVFEDLKLQNMTAAPAPKQDSKGRYTANGAAAKAGLNKALLANALGQVKLLATYKAARRNKLVLGVSPYQTSQECAACGHTAAENRPAQAVFACVACGHADNADANAARVIARRGVAALRAGVPVRKAKKTARVRGHKNKESTVGPVRPEPGGKSRPKPVGSVSDAGGRKSALGAMPVEAGNHPLSAGRR